MITLNASLGFAKNYILEPVLKTTMFLIISSSFAERIASLSGEKEKLDSLKQREILACLQDERLGKDWGDFEKQSIKEAVKLWSYSEGYCSWYANTCMRLFVSIFAKFGVPTPWKRSVTIFSQKLTNGDREHAESLLSVLIHAVNTHKEDFFAAMKDEAKKDFIKTSKEVNDHFFATVTNIKESVIPRVFDPGTNFWS